MNFTFGKSYKLCNKKYMDAIFESGSTQKQYPVLARYKTFDLAVDVPFQMVISAPKRTFRSAVKRNRIKRICREAVRKNKHELEVWLRENEIQLGIFFLYSGKDEISVAKLEHKTQQLFQKIIHDLQTKHSS